MLIKKLSQSDGNNLVGFATANAMKGEGVEILARATLTSDNPFFYKYCEAFVDNYLTKVGVVSDSVYRYFIVVHADTSVDIYVNDFPVIVEIKTKRDITVGESIVRSDIADIKKVKFPQITILETDKVIYCFKVGWRFGLFFDLFQRVLLGDVPAVEKLDVDKMEHAIGDLYRYLVFYDVYKTIESESHFNDLLVDGWFPFIEIIGSEYSEISSYYENRFDFENKIKLILDRFDVLRINEIIKKWWKHPIFNEKKLLISAGVNAYLTNTPEGFVNSISTLIPMVEGILRKMYFLDTGRGARVKSNDLINFIIQKGWSQSVVGSSLFLPEYFLKYLENYIFSNFDLKNENISLSRNSVGHGVADIEEYNRIRSLQYILILDQIYFYTMNSITT